MSFLAAFGSRCVVRCMVPGRPLLAAYCRRMVSGDTTVPSDQLEMVDESSAEHSKTDESADVSTSSLGAKEIFNRPNKRLYLKNLPIDLTEDQLKSHFLGCVTVNIPWRLDHKMPYKYGFVEYDSIEDAQKALQEGLEIDGTSIEMNYAQAPRQQGFSSQSPVLFLKNLPFGVTVDQLQSIFVTSVGIRIPTDMHTGRQKGFAYIDFKSVADAQVALSENKGLEIDGRQIYMDFGTTKFGAKKFKQRSSSFTVTKHSAPSPILFLKNFPYDTTEDTLRNYFPNCVAVRLPTRSFTGTPLGFAYVEFASVSEAEEAFAKSRGMTIGGRPIHFDFATEQKRKTSPIFQRRIARESFEDPYVDVKSLDDSSEERELVLSERPQEESFEPDVK